MTEQTEEYVPKLSALGAVVNGRVARVQRGILAGEAPARAALAALRNAVTADPGATPAIWSWTEVAVPDGAGDAATTQEVAAHTAMTLYAVHQQSQQRPMHVSGRGLGRAMRDLVFRSGEEDPAARARFNRLVTSATTGELRYHLRSAISQLRSEGIPMDYGMLADDLVRFQWPEGADVVRRRWARQYDRAPLGGGL